MFKLNLTHFLLNTFLKKKCHFKVQLSSYSNTVFYSYSEYIVKDETYSLDMFATS